MHPISTIALHRLIFDTHFKLDIWTSFCFVLAFIWIQLTSIVQYYPLDDTMQHQPLERISVSRKARRVSRRRCKVSFQNLNSLHCRKEGTFFFSSSEGGTIRKRDQISVRGMRERTVDLTPANSTPFRCRRMIGQSANGLGRD